jgi:hypothetical protein
MWSSQRGLTPRCCVTPTAVSGASEKLETVSPSMRSFGMPARATSASSAAPMNQCAPCVE